MNYVSPEASKVAHSWEQRFRETRKMAGIIFVSVVPHPAPDGQSKDYTVTLGLKRGLPFDDSTVRGIIFKVLEREVASGLYQIHTNVSRGSSGACYEGDEGSGQAPPS